MKVKYTGSILRNGIEIEQTVWVQDTGNLKNMREKAKQLMSENGKHPIKSQPIKW